MKQITKKIGCFLIGLGALSVTTITTPLVVKQLISLNSVTLNKDPLSTLFPTGSSLSVSTKAPSSDEASRNKDLLTMMKKTKPNDFNDAYDQSYYTIENYSYNTTNKTGSFKITPTNNNPIYDGSATTLNFSVNPNGAAVLSNFFGGTTYNITLNIGSKLTSAYFPAIGTNVTSALLLQAIKSATYNSQKININQLKCSDPTWDKTNDYYTATLSVKPGSNFYDPNSASVTIQFNRERIYVNGSTFDNAINGTRAYYYIPDGGFDENVLWDQLADINTAATVGSAGYIFKDTSFDGNVTWSNKTTLTPYFQLSGDQKYSTKTQTAVGSQSQNNAVVNVSIADKIDLNTYVIGKNVATNGLLAFTDTDLPTIDDIKWAITTGGGGQTGTPPTPIALDINFDAVLEVSTPSGSNGSGTCTITAGAKSLLYKNAVTISFTYTYAP